MAKPVDVLIRLRASTIVDENSGCWIFRGSDNAGYGRIFYNKKHERAHRVSAHLFLHYDLTSKKIVCHKPNICFSRACWNPDHLYIGTDSSNICDIVKSGKHNNASKTHCPRGHEYSKENTYIRARGRDCITCRKARTKR